MFVTMKAGHLFMPLLLVLSLKLLGNTESIIHGHEFYYSYLIQIINDAIVPPVIL